MIREILDEENKANTVTYDNPSSIILSHTSIPPLHDESSQGPRKISIHSSIVKRAAFLVPRKAKPKTEI
jgi:hypothetical protein